MELVKPPTLAAFRAAAEPLLLAHEVEHGLILSIASTPDPPPDAYCAVVMHDGRPVAAAVRTIHKAVISREAAHGALALIVPDLLRDPELRGILGPRPSVETFVAESGREWREGMSQ